MESPRKKVAYDPDQDPEEKRVLRQKYRVLLKDEEGTNEWHTVRIAIQTWKNFTHPPALSMSFLLYFTVRPPTERQ